MVQADVTVVGGGLAGVCAAIAAARLGRKVALVQNRPVLGGNSSSEIRVWIGGANGLTHNRYARESGIIGELLLENQYRNQEGNPYIWDLVILEAVKAEPGIRLFLNTDVRDVAVTGESNERGIESVTGWMTGSERLIRFESPLFLDCTGDGLVGFLAGAEHRIGREARSTFGEPWAPAEADAVTLGSTIFFHTKVSSTPVPFERPSFARDITTTSIPISRILSTGDSGARYWWIEFGGELDTLHDDAQIREELWAAVYGIWDYIKNSGKFDADYLTLEWIGAIPGKRETRRFVGDYTFTQNDVITQRLFDDRVAYGGWMVDLHPPEGMYSPEGAAKNMYANGVFHIPFRSLYSANVSNLLFAGRNISASHAGFGATRVMATCAAMGEAAGTAAALCGRHSVTPRILSQARIGELQQQLLAQDAPVMGIPNQDPTDLAREAIASASSTCREFADSASDVTWNLDRDVGFLVPVAPVIGRLELLLDVDAATSLVVELWRTERPENFVPHELVTKATCYLTPGAAQWVTVDLPWAPASAAYACVVVRKVAGVRMHLAQRPQTGTLSYVHAPERIPNQFHIDGTDEYPPLVLEWDMKPLMRKAFCFRVAPATEAFVAANVVNGYPRPYGLPNLWVSGLLQSQEWLQLEWNRKHVIKRVAITFNDDVNENLNNLHKWITPSRVMPELVKDYRIEAYVEGEWRQIAMVTGNRRRRRVHVLEEAIDTDKLRLVMAATNGALRAEVFEVRVYG